MPALMLPSLSFYQTDNTGEPLANGTVEVYYSQTSQPAITYKDSQLNAANEHPIPLSQTGKADIYLEEGVYNIIARDSSGGVVYSTNDYQVSLTSGGGGTPTETVPIGGIIMYSGLFADKPDNYAFCDGTNNTPNLVDKFIRATADEGLLNTTGGSNDAILVNHVHSVGEHTHSVGTHAHTINAHNHTSAAHHHTTSAHTHTIPDHNHTGWSDIHPTKVKSIYSSSVNGTEKSMVNDGWSTAVYTGDGSGTGTQAGIGTQFYSTNNISISNKTGLATNTGGGANTGNTTPANTGDKALTTNEGGVADTGSNTIFDTGTTGDTESGVGANIPGFIYLAFIQRKW